jgi:hypothetical protein
MTRLKFFAAWDGEPDAGLHAGSEIVSIQFQYGQSLDEDTIEYWRDAVADFYDGAYVELLRTEEK